LNKLLSYDFPGNIRGLEHIITRAYFRHRGNEIQEGDIVIKMHKKEVEVGLRERIYQEMRKERKNFCEAVHELFLRRNLKRSEAKEILDIGGVQRSLHTAFPRLR
jgi:transcriptional regulator with PAS, ATPase and Fis domain